MGVEAVPETFSWRGILFSWRAPYGSQSAQYEGFDHRGPPGLWFSVRRNEGDWVACCYTPLGCVSYPQRALTKEGALDKALHESREAVGLTYRALEAIE